MEEEGLKSNPLYKNVLEYLSKPKLKIPENRSFQRKRLLRNTFFLVSAFFGLIMAIGILGLGLNLIKSNLNPAQELQPVLMSTVEPKMICKRFDNLEEALKNIDMACVLDLSGKELTNLPPDVSKLTKLNELSLKNNNITRFPVELLSFTVRHPNVNEKPKTIGFLPDLYSLDLSDNKITTLAPQIQQKVTQVQQQAQGGTVSPILQSLKLTGNNISEDEKTKLKQLLPTMQITF